MDLVVKYEDAESDSSPCADGASQESEDDARSLHLQLNTPIGEGCIGLTVHTGAEGGEQLALLIQLCTDGCSEFLRRNHSLGKMEALREGVNRLNMAFSDMAAVNSASPRHKRNVEVCTTGTLRTICDTVFSRAVPNPKELNKHYRSDSSEVYGETTFDQLQLVAEHLHLGENDVFVDLGSGVGHVVVYIAGMAKVKKVIGIECAELPAKHARQMAMEFEGMMHWYGKKYSDFELLEGDFMDAKYFDLITKEATVLFINNYAFKPKLETAIMSKLIVKLEEGVRIVATKPYAVHDRSINDRKMHSRVAGLEAMLDVEEMPTVDRPASWTDKKVAQYLHTVNFKKIQQYYDWKNKKQAGAPNDAAAAEAEPSGAAASPALFGNFDPWDGVSSQLFAAKTPDVGHKSEEKHKPRGEKRSLKVDEEEKTVSLGEKRVRNVIASRTTTTVRVEEAAAADATKKQVVKVVAPLPANPPGRMDGRYWEYKETEYKNLITHIDYDLPRTRRSARVNGEQKRKSLQGIL